MEAELLKANEKNKPALEILERAVQALKLS